MPAGGHKNMPLVGNMAGIPEQPLSCNETNPNWEAAVANLVHSAQLVDLDAFSKLLIHSSPHLTKEKVALEVTRLPDKILGREP